MTLIPLSSSVRFTVQPASTAGDDKSPRILPVTAPSADNRAGKTQPTVAALSASSSSSSGDNDSTASDSPEVPAASRPFATSLQKLLKYMRQTSDHIIRRNTAAWEPGYPGLLVSEWQGDDEDQWAHPLSLVFVEDSKASESRVMSTTLPAHQKALPLLPYWSFGVRADGDCLVRCAAMGDVACVNEDLEGIIKAIITCGKRDPVFLTVDSADQAIREREQNAIGQYRKLYVEHTQRMA